MPDQIRMGQIYVDAKPPRREWRVVKQTEDRFVLQRVDRPGVSRIPAAETLLDGRRYQRVG